MTRKATVLILAFLAAAISLPAAPPAEEPPVPDPATLHGQVAMLNETMSGMTAILEEFLQRQQADLLMKRIQIAARGLTELENRVSKSREEIDSLTRDRTRLTDEIARIEAALDEDQESQPGMPNTAQERREVKAQMERELRFISDRLISAENRLIDLENQLADRLDDLAAWEELVDKALGLK